MRGENERSSYKPPGLQVHPHRYEAPELRVLGPVAELTQRCDKKLGGSDFFIFRGIQLTCTSG